MTKRPHTVAFSWCIPAEELADMSFGEIAERFSAAATTIAALEQRVREQDAEIERLTIGYVDREASRERARAAEREAAAALASAEALNERLVKFVRRMDEQGQGAGSWYGEEARALLATIDKGDGNG